MKLVLIDDHPMVLHGVSAVVHLQEDMEVVGTSVSGEVGLDLIEKLQPDIALVDLRLADENGLDIIRRGRLTAPGCRFVILTSFGRRAEVKQAISERVEGYILKEATPEEIIGAIRLVARGRQYLDPAVMDDLINHQHDDPIEQLTPRELEVLEALARGMSNREIASTLYVTEYTVKKHVSQILDKLELVDRTQAALLAFSRGMGHTGDFAASL